MATYTVPQDVEAEDKLLGPLTFKQLIFLMIAAGGGLMAWFLYQVQPYLVVIPLPVIIVFGGLAVFRKEDQPAEQYLLSLFNFLVRPRKRVWNPEGYYDHLVLTPERKAQSPELKQGVDQVHGQLEKLAQLVDTRGWASKRPDLTLPGQGLRLGGAGDDRLFLPDNPASDPDDIHTDDDIMDDDNPGVRELDEKLQRDQKEYREQLLQNVRQQITNNSQETVGKPKALGSDSPDSSVATAHSTVNEEPSESTTPTEKPQAQPSSDILEVADQVSISRLADAANRRDNDHNLQEGEEIRLR